jgi:hypothetical protein
MIGRNGLLTDWPQRLKIEFGIRWQTRFHDKS